jgi:hypothetical protein
LLACPEPARDDGPVRAALEADLDAQPPRPMVAAPWAPVLKARLRADRRRRITSP